ncbi:hypothetical protein MTO96_022080 [Rhipicephalus appendiculatus]
MVSPYAIAIILALCCWAVRWWSIPRVDDSLVSEEAKKNNADGIEFDLTFTRDNVAVIFHDDTLERTTNGEGPIDNITFEELRRLDASCKHPLAERFPRERVPTLEEGVEECLRLGMRMIIDVKRYDSRAVEVVDKLFREKPELYGRALVASFYHNYVYLLRRRNPGIVTALTWQPGVLSFEDMNNTRPYHESFLAHMFDRMADWLLDKALHSGFLPYLTGASVVMISDNMMNVDYVKAWDDRGMHVIAWTPNDPAEKDFFRQSLWEHSGRRTADKETLETSRTAETSGYTSKSGHAAAASSTPRGYKSHGFYDVYQGYDKGFSDIIYWVPLIIIFGAGIIFLPVLGALFATFAAGTAGAAVSTTVAGRRRRRRELSTLDVALDALSALEKAIEKFGSAS